eukprot:scaffold3853_cov118-Isochrysis_galbana.AAC.3
MSPSRGASALGAGSVAAGAGGGIMGGLRWPAGAPPCEASPAWWMRLSKRRAPAHDGRLTQVQLQLAMRTHRIRRLAQGSHDR